MIVDCKGDSEPKAAAKYHRSMLLEYYMEGHLLRSRVARHFYSKYTRCRYIARASS